MYSSTLSLTSALDGVGGQRLALGRFTLGKKTRCPLYRKPVWTGAENLSSTPGFHPRTVQPVAQQTVNL
jgi:hypothetical protein